MNNLDYCLSLKKQGLDRNQIKSKLIEKELDEKDINNLLKESDSIFLDELSTKKNLPRKKYFIKTFILLFSFFLLILAFLGHAHIGIIGLLIIWGSLGLLKIKRKSIKQGYLGNRKYLFF